MADEVKTPCKEQLESRRFQELQLGTEKCLQLKEMSTAREFQLLQLNLPSITIV